jgi:hypothetical protein
VSERELRPNIIIKKQKMQETSQDKHHKVAKDMDKVNQVLQYKES